VLRSLFDCISISPDDVLVDVGCGHGRIINFWLSQRIKNKIVGIEANPEAAKDAAARYKQYPNVEIIEGFAERIAQQFTGAIFYLFNPFSEQILADFERALRGSNARIVYYAFHGLGPFENPAWKIKIVRKTEPHWCQYRCAYISPAQRTERE
jgi:precorrin-6B methylase 2